MKSSNPLVMVQAYRLLVQKMDEEFGECYPLHLGVTEAGDGEDGRIKSAIGIGTLLEDGIGDTIRVSLTEDPEFEIPVCRDIVKRYEERSTSTAQYKLLMKQEKIALPYDPFSYKRRSSTAINNIGGTHVPVVIADFSDAENITVNDLQAIGYQYNEATDKWSIGDGAADYIYTGDKLIEFALPGTLQVICNSNVCPAVDAKYHALLTEQEFLDEASHIPELHFVAVDANSNWEQLTQVIGKAKENPNTVLCISSSNAHAMPSVRRFVIELLQQQCNNPIILKVRSNDSTIDEQLIHLATETGALFLEGFGDGIWLQNDASRIQNQVVTGRTYLPVSNNHQFLNNTAFSVLQAARTRISKTEYISCPSCGRTLFDLQETTAKIRAATTHLKGIKIAIMGCIVNGPGEMADADFGYVGNGPGKITLYKGKEVVKKNVPSETAVDELIQLLKENEAWIEPAMI